MSRKILRDKMPVLLSIIIPVYNEERTIELLLQKLVGVVWPSGGSVQIIVVDDGSADGSARCVERFRQAHPTCSLILLRHAENSGKGSAIRTALPYAEGRYTVIQDGDEEYSPCDLAAMLAQMIDKDLKVLYGSRYLGGGRRERSLYPAFYYGVRLLSMATNLLYQQHITDEATCYKMFRTDLLRSLHLKCRGFEFCPEVTARVSLRGVRIDETAISYAPRSISEGKKIRIRDGLYAFWILLKYRFKILSEL